MERDDFVLVAERRCFGCWRDTSVTKGRHVVCTKCGVARFCGRNCWNGAGWHDCEQYAQRMANKTIAALPKSDLPSYEVAFRKTYFGEGAERIVRKFRFLDDRGNFCGPRMVAKESRFVKERKETQGEEMAYHKEFLRTQAISL